MTTRLKESERQSMLISYIKDKIVPEGFYVKTMKDGRIQFRRVKVKLSEEEELKKKIQMYEKKIEELKNKLNDVNQAAEVNDEVTTETAAEEDAN